VEQARRAVIAVAAAALELRSAQAVMRAVSSLYRLRPAGPRAYQERMMAEGDFKLYRCGACGFVYNERAGLEEEGIAPGTRWETIPDDWTCPDCGSAKADFETNDLKK
jgi:rubredoxin